MGYSVAVTSGNGGAGKTTVAAGLALAFAEAGQSTLLWELTPGRRCCDKLLGADGVAFDLSDLLAGSVSIRDVCVPVVPSLSLLAAPLEHGVSVDSDEVFRVGAELNRAFEVVVIDLGSDSASLRASAWANEVLFVCEPDVSSVDAAAAAARYVGGISEQTVRMGLVVNRLPPSRDERAWLPLNLSEIIDQSGIPLRAVLPRSHSLGLAVPYEEWLEEPDPDDEQLARTVFAALRLRLFGERVPLCLR